MPDNDKIKTLEEWPTPCNAKMQFFKLMLVPGDWVQYCSRMDMLLPIQVVC